MGTTVATKTDQAENTVKKRSARHLRMTRRHHARRLTKYKRIAGCGRWAVDQTAGVHIRKRPDGDGCYFTGTQHCASVWACPVCSATIGQRRAAELAAGLQRWLDADHGAHFVTLTIPHTSATRLRPSLDAVIKAWTKSLTGREWQSICRAFGIKGYVRTVEATWGEANGWHPHIHAVFLTADVLDTETRRTLYRLLFARWQRAVERVAGLTPGELGFHAEPVQRGTELGHYLIKLGLELHRSDLKSAHKTDRYTPMHLLDQAADGEAWARRLWTEWERATHGRRFMTWGKGTRQALGITAPEKTDEELVQEMQGGEIIAHIDAYMMHKITSVPGVDADLLSVAELWGRHGVLDYLRTVQLLT